jgi:hypothetical protein
LQAFESAYYSFAQWRRDHYQRCEARHYIVIGKDADRGIGRIFPKSRVPEGGSYYTRCCNLPVQGACADASMLALAYVDDRLYEAGIEGGPVAWLHDEIVLEVREDQAERAAEILKQSMIDGFVETFPGAPLNGLVEPHIGANWGETIGEAPKSPPTELNLFSLYIERFKLLRRDVSEDEAKARAFEFTVAAYRAHHGVDLEVAKQAVLAAIRRGVAP